jgi:cell division protein FtsB
MMKSLKLLLPIWCALTFYAILSLLTGHGGVSAYKELLSDRNNLSENVNAINNSNAKLRALLESLQSDKETIAFYAREQGFGTTDERFFRIVGLSPSQRQIFEKPAVLYFREPEHFEDKYLRLGAISVAIFMFLLVSIGSFVRFMKKN